MAGFGCPLTFEKIGDAIHGYSAATPKYGLMHVELVHGAVEGFKTELDRRSLTGAYDSVDYYLGLLDYPIRRLMDFFADPESGISDQDAYIYMFFVSRHVKELKKIADELDEDYQSDP